MDKGSPKLGRSLQSAMKEALKLEKAYRLVEEERASAVHQARAAEGEMDEAVEGTMVWDAAGEMEGVTEGVNGRGAESAADYAAEETEVEQLAQEDHELDPAVANPLQHPEGYEGEEFDLKSDYQEKIKASAVHILAVHLSEMVQLFEDGLNIAPGHSGTQHIIVPPCVSCVDADTLCTALLGQPCCERCRGQQKVCDRGACAVGTLMFLKARKLIIY